MTEYILAHCVDSVSGVRYDERREEIVRCRDCKHADWLAVVGIGVLHCCYHGWTQTGDPDGFCKWGRKER